MEAIRLNQFIVCAPKATDAFTERPQPIGREYIEKGSAVIQRATSPIHRYAKNYTTSGKNGVKFCLFVLTFSVADKAIEVELDKAAKSITKDDANTYLASGNITYLDKYLEIAK